VLGRGHDGVDELGQARVPQDVVQRHVPVRDDDQGQAERAQVAQDAGHLGVRGEGDRLEQGVVHRGGLGGRPAERAAHHLGARPAQLGEPRARARGVVMAAVVGDLRPHRGTGVRLSRRDAPRRQRGPQPRDGRLEAHERAHRVEQHRARRAGHDTHRQLANRR
jgi:hypothetical protein